MGGGAAEHSPWSAVAERSGDTALDSFAMDAANLSRDIRIYRRCSRIVHTAARQVL